MRYTRALLGASLREGQCVDTVMRAASDRVWTVHRVACEHKPPIRLLYVLVVVAVRFVRFRCVQTIKACHFTNDQDFISKSFLHDFSVLWRFSFYDFLDSDLGFGQIFFAHNYCVCLY